MATGSIPCTHDFYLKLFHIYLHQKDIDLPTYDLLMLDECGDINPVTLEVFKLIPSKRKVAVGDKHQNIFTFNHTINCFEVIPEEDSTVLSMSKSFRVNTLIAKSVERFMREFIEPDYSFIGNKTDNVIETRAYLTRTNSVLIAKMIELNESQTPYGLLRKAKQIFHIPILVASITNGGYISDPTYKHIQADYDDWYSDSDLKMLYSNPLSYVKSLYKDDIVLNSAIALVLKHGSKAIYDALKEATKHESKCQKLTLATVHSSKGSEWDEVYIASDINSMVFNLIKDLQQTGKIEEGSVAYRDVINLAYVAFSRAKKRLINAESLNYTKEMSTKGA